MAERANKKLKVETAVLDPQLLSTPKAQRKEIQDKYVATKPYPHYQIPILCTKEHMNKVHNECVTHLQGNYKETDLFKLYQTIDLGNLKHTDDVAKNLPSLLQLRDALYGEEFRQYIQDITGCPKLTEKVDCAANVYMAGCHLLPHDDVISTRCVSYVIYLSDPEDTWTAQDGGQLEIYPEMESNKRVPDLIPTAFALPSYNTMALFTVIPGVSFHSVQEVYADKPRLSIQGWFHQEAIPSGVEEATNEQIKVFSALESPFAELSMDIVQEPQLTNDDITLLKKFINPIYLGKSTIQMIQKSFQDNGSLQLHDFLHTDFAESISIATNAADQRSKLGNGKIPQYKAGYGKQWEPRGPVHLQRYLEYMGKGDDSEEATAGELLAFVKENLFASPPFQKFIWLITGFLPTSVRQQVRRFRAGLDYTLAHKQSCQESTLLDLVLCFVDTNSTDAQEAWSSGDVGGFECFMSAEEDGLGDVAKGLEDEDNELIVTVHALNNALNLGLHDENTMKFVKFLSARAPSSRWDVKVEYEIAQVELEQDD
ncbi:hypothetical protein THRCLA_08503 [Thraustotheca clavata]|uniref:Fe2OG dioxygenase domain-containing protein n=1 Tax=Thraustotheca clavata TaxID=74557 RepID=A0A1V9Z5B3_9STRA|nr:hypothetical protein THRCLA_08503 [Thraustotheca clavata]